MLEHRTPLADLLRSHPSGTTQRAGFQVAPTTGSGFLLLQGDPEDAPFQEAILRHLGVRLPSAREISIGGNFTLLWMTPREWLLELPAREVSAVQGALTVQFALTLAAVNDVSDSFACFDIGGDRAVDILMTGCSLDLRPAAFPAGHVARTGIADVPALLWKQGNSHRFRCLVDRSFAEHFWNWLAQSSAAW